MAISSRWMETLETLEVLEEEVWVVVVRDRGLDLGFEGEAVGCCWSFWADEEGGEPANRSGLASRSALRIHWSSSFILDGCGDVRCNFSIEVRGGGESSRRLSFSS